MNDKYISVSKFKQSLAKLTVEGGDKKYAEAIARTLSEVVPHLLDDSPAADVQPVDRWISVNNRPEKDGKYLCYLESGNVCEAYYDSTIASEGEFPFGEWVGRYDSNTLGFIDTDWQPYDAITHWQPLPEPPKDGETNA